jgi:hemin uptake protein HemP
MAAVTWLIERCQPIGQLSEILLTLSLSKDTTVGHDAVSRLLTPDPDVIADSPSEPARDRQPAASDQAQREVDSRELMQGQREIVIRHGEEAYRLSVTRSGKLILRK